MGIFNAGARSGSLRTVEYYLLLSAIDYCGNPCHCPPLQEDHVNQINGALECQLLVTFEEVAIWSGFVFGKAQGRG